MIEKLRRLVFLLVVAWAVGALAYRVVVGARLKPALEGRVGQGIMVEKVRFHDWYLMNSIRSAEIEVSRDISSLVAGNPRGLRRERLTMPVEIHGRWQPGAVQPGQPRVIPGSGE